MRLVATSLLLGAICSGLNGAGAQLELVAGKQPQPVFGGSTRKIELLWRNSGETMLETDLQMRLTQLTSAMAVTVTEAPWKKLQVLPGQTITETASLEFPAVRARTRFLVQWFGNTNQVIGSTEILAYPTNLLAELQPLVGHEDGALGVFDPLDGLKPLLKRVKVNFVDLGDVELEKFRGKLAIIGPFASKRSVDPALGTRIKAIAKKGVAIVWIQPPHGDSSLRDEQPAPSFYSVTESQTAAVITQAHLVANLAENPRSQLNLIYFCKIALHPQPLTFPVPQTQP